MLDHGDDSTPTAEVTSLVDRIQTIARLAALDPVGCEQQIPMEAEKLGVKAKTLEREVRKARRSALPEALRNPSPTALADFALNEDGVALAFAREVKDKLLYCHHAQQWFYWTGAVWKKEETKLAFSWAREVCRKAGDSLEENDKRRDVLARASTSAAVERYAQTEREFAVTNETWNKDGWLLGTPDGTVDLRTGELKPADLKDRITKQTAVGPAPKGTPHPHWTTFLAEATGNDQELQNFLQRFAGYCLTGDVREEVIVFIYGEGGSGKGTFISTIVSILADYAVSLPIEVFTAGSRLNLEYYRAQMAGARFVTASETEAGAMWSESQLKEMSGNETPLSARQPHGRAFTYWPQFKIGLVGNHAPRLKSRSKAMERRLRMTPFNHLPSKVDTDLKHKLLGEMPAILRWVIDGCQIWQRDGLGTCDAVEAETCSYFEQQDAFGRWLAERCTMRQGCSEKPSKLLSDFLAWGKENAEGSVTSTEFREMIERTKGLSYSRGGGRQVVTGIKLQEPAVEDASPNEVPGGTVMDLLRKAAEHFRDTERANVWIDSALPKLGMKKPADVCTEPGGMQMCLNVLLH